MSDHTDYIIKFIKETAALRRDLVQGNEFGEPMTIEFSGREIAGVTYALALAYITEWINSENGHRKIMEMLSDASATVLTVASGEEIDTFLNKVLGEGDDKPG